MGSCCLLGWRHLFAQCILMKVRFQLDRARVAVPLLGQLGLSSVEWGSAFVELALVLRVRLGEPMAFALLVPSSVALTSSPKRRHPVKVFLVRQKCSGIDMFMWCQKLACNAAPLQCCDLRWHLLPLTAAIRL